jgi:hypothetical protein
VLYKTGLFSGGSTFSLFRYLKIIGQGHSILRIGTRTASYVLGGGLGLPGMGVRLLFIGGSLPV